MNWLKQRWMALCGYWRTGKASLEHAYRNLQTTLRTLSGRTRYRVVEEKETFVVTVGVVEGLVDGRQAVVIKGQQLAQRVRAEGLARITETLYQIGYEWYLVHVRTLYRTKGLRTELDLCEVSEADLALGGTHVELGQLRPRSWEKVGVK